MRFPKTLLAALASLFAAGVVQAAGFASCDDSYTSPALKGSRCSTETVPLVWRETPASGAGVIKLFVREFPASGKSKGTVWLVAGGPGESGASLYPMIDVLRHSFPGYDLRVPDHRGTGFSTRLCAQEEAPDSAAGTGLDRAEFGTCFGRLIGDPATAKGYTITESAHDLRYLIKNSDRTRPIYVYGVSYGTQLILRTLQLGKLPVTGIVLDSLVPLQTAAKWELTRRSHVVDDIGRQVLARCDREPQCRRAMGEGAETAYRRLLSQVRERPELLDGIPGRDLKRFLGNLLDVPAARDQIPYLIKELEAGRTERLKGVLVEMEKAAASLGAFAQSPISIPLVSIISTSENALRQDLTSEELDREDGQLLFTSGLPRHLLKPALPLYPRDRYFGKLPAQTPPLLVFSGTLDPKTHYDGAVEHVAALKKSGRTGLVSVTGAPHFILWTAPQCFARHTRAFVERRVLYDQRCAMAPKAL